MSKLSKSLFLFFGATLATILLCTFLFYVFFPDKVFQIHQNLQRSSADLELEEIQTPDHKIVYLDNHQKKPTIVMLHGLNAHKDHFPAFASFFKQQFRVIIPDLPGHAGMSEAFADKSYRIENQIAYLHQFITAMKLEKFHLVGSSLGGFIAARYSAKYPNLVLSLCLLNSAGVKSAKPSEYLRLIDKNKNDNVLLIKTEADFRKMLEYSFYEPPYIPGKVLSFLVAEAAKRREFAEKMFRESIYEEKTFLEPVLAQITMPTLIIFGEADRIIDVSSAHILDKNIPKSQLILMPKTGHGPMIERPEETARHYLNFLLN